MGGIGGQIEGLDADKSCFAMGQSAGGVHEVLPAGEIVARLMAEAHTAISRLSRLDALAPLPRDRRRSEAQRAFPDRGPMRPAPCGPARRTPRPPPDATAPNPLQRQAVIDPRLCAGRGARPASGLRRAGGQYLARPDEPPPPGRETGRRLPPTADGELQRGLHGPPRRVPHLHSQDRRDGTDRRRAGKNLVPSSRVRRIALTHRRGSWTLATSGWSSAKRRLGRAVCFSAS